MRRLGVVIFPDFQLLDATGPISAFAIAGRYAGDAYGLQLLAHEGGQIMSSAGVALAAGALDDAPYDTLLAVGGDVRQAPTAAIADWLKVRAPQVRRVASVCTGAFFLAEAGLLDGRRATTHWESCGHLARRYPGVQVEADRIYVRDGHVWTSAGITAGIDLALAMIEEDLGAEVARRTAQQLVLHHRRAGGQSQFSELLDLGGTSGRFGGLLDWARDRLGERLSVDRLAEQAGMSPRNFARAFNAEVGVTPAKAVERLRLEAARLRTETCREPIERIAETVGFGDAERMRRAFLRAFGQPPQALRRAAQPA